MTASDRAEQNLILRCPEPLNAETPPDKLITSFLTPQANFYIRSHGPTPELADDHRIALDGLVDRPRSYTVAELQTAFATRTVTATMQCAGNRRAHLQDVEKTSGDPWDVGAIGNAAWTGVALCDVLAAAGIQDGASFVGTTGADDVDVDGETAPFGASISIAKALEPDVLIAWAMNGEALAPEHGAPLRLVVPGYAGVRSAKWLTRIEVRDRPSDAPIQAKDYKLFPASVAKEDADWDRGLTIEEMPLNAAICAPRGRRACRRRRVRNRGLCGRLRPSGLARRGLRQWRHRLAAGGTDRKTRCALELDAVARHGRSVARTPRPGRARRRRCRADAARTARGDLELRRLSLDCLASHHRHRRLMDAPHDADRAHAKLAESASTLKDSAVQQVDSADRRTELAADRTILAGERTYAAWVRTGLAALASGIGARALLKDVVFPWLATATGTMLILFSAFCFVAAVWREMGAGAPPPRPDIKRLPAALLLVMNGFLMLVSLAALVGIWTARS